ncbi:hypothetical protein N7457_001910 [Penicillium paradoxum]|uniref:uncharacterized protein n=1 Tax=Penicillium paradoxum TaxID=176176 RepID=UPI0025466CE7|nr:uncharacterized protein N7457_001910 [Penicillium paradoxum]KAJ5795311.1 hypothetical protein N7457_001910 [Penicillium paradoxum]
MAWATGDPGFVFEAKRSGLGTGDGQILAYMAMVWASRKKRNQSDSAVYGCLTDIHEFRFFHISHISHKGLWSQMVFLFSLCDDRRQGMNTVNYLASFLKHRLNTSP